MNTIYIGIDNGVSGTIGILDKNGKGHQFPMPVKKTLSYQKTKARYIHRIDVNAFRELLRDFLYEYDSEEGAGHFLPSKAFLERPMVNSGRFQSTISALRALEATLIVLEDLNIGYEYVDSKAWQKLLLPKVTKEQYKKDKGIYKRLSLEVGKRKYPEIDFLKMPDADGILIAEACRIYHNQGG